MCDAKMPVLLCVYVREGETESGRESEKNTCRDRVRDSEGGVVGRERGARERGSARDRARAREKEKEDV